MKIYLVGMPGSGKSTLGAQVADILNLEFIDLDKEIEARAGRTVSEIFSAAGENHFRQLESSILIELSGSARNFIMATGGGAPCFHGGMSVINNSGLSIFLDEPISLLLTRLENKTDRPLLYESDNVKRKEKLEALRKSRLECYQLAAIVLKGADMSKILEEIRIRTKTQR